MLSRHPLYLTKSDRIVLLLVLAIAAIVVLTTQTLVMGTSETTAVTDSVSNGRSNRTGQYADRPTGTYTYATNGQEIRYTYFDPNTADSTQLLSLGLQPWQVRAIYRYRAHGGVYRRPTDFARLYGLTAKQYRQLEPYIRISDDYRPASEVYGTTPAEPHHPSADTLRYPVKLRNHERIALNQADTTLLMRVPGIGSYYARRIVAYRTRLGGFAHASQLMEIDDFPAEALPFFTVDAQQIHRINLNQMTLTQLRRHPYINYLQARAICDYRRLKGPLSSLDQLRLLPDFPAQAIERLRPYVEF